MKNKVSRFLISYCICIQRNNEEEEINKVMSSVTYILVLAS